MEANGMAVVPLKRVGCFERVCKSRDVPIACESADDAESPGKAALRLNVVRDAVCDRRDNVLFDWSEPLTDLIIVTNGLNETKNSQKTEAFYKIQIRHNPQENSRKIN
jgi:hypothetical protein